MQERVDGSPFPAITYLHVLLRRKWVVLSALAAGVIVAAVHNFRATPVYCGTARIMIREEASRIAGVQDWLPAPSDQRPWYETQVRMLKSRTVLREAAERLRLGTWPEFEGMSERNIVSALADRVTVEPEQNSYLALVSFEGYDQERVHEVANEIVHCSRENSIRRRRLSSSSATEWMRDELPDLEARLYEAEDNLQAFREEHNIVNLDPEKGIVFGYREELYKDLLAAERKHRAVKAQGRLVEGAATPAEIEGLPVIFQNPTIRALDARRLALLERRIDLLKGLAPGHRDVQTLDAKLTALTRERERVIQIVLDATRNSVLVAKETEDEVRSLFEKQQLAAKELNKKMIDIAKLKRKVERAGEPYERLLARSERLGLAAGLDAPSVKMVDPAERPDGPDKPRKTVNLVVGAMLGLLAGFAAAFLVEQVDTALRSPQDLERATHLAVVGAIPHMEEKSPGKRATTCSVARSSNAAEAYRSLRTRLLQSWQESGPAVLLVTSTTNREGKTTTAMNVGVAYAQIGKRVLLLDADLRRPAVHQLLGLANSGGLSSCLADGREAHEVVQPSGIDKLDVITSGPSPKNPAELLGSGRLDEVVAWGKENYDLVVLDSPPLSMVTDGLILAPQMDGVILVVRAGVTSKSMATHGRKLLDGAKAAVVGGVLNDIRKSDARYGYYGYYYHHYYNRPYGKQQEA